MTVAAGGIGDSPFGVGQRSRQPGASPFGVGLGTFGLNQNLLGTQVNPANSAATNTAFGQATTAKNALAGFNFGGFQPVQQPMYGDAQNALTTGNNQIQNAGLNYGGANSQYLGAQNTLAQARQQASGLLGGSNGLSLSSFHGGGGAQADTGTLNSQLANANSYVGPQYGSAADTGTARGLTLASLQNAQNAPDRGQLAAQNLSLFEQRSQPGYDASVRQLGQQAAAMGRRGSGLVNSQLADLGTARETTLAQERRQLATDAAGQTLQDRLNVTNAGLGVTQGFGAEDRGAVNTRLAQSGQLSSNAGQQFSGSLANANLAEQAAARTQQGTLAYAQQQGRTAEQLYGMGSDAANLQGRYGDSLATQANNQLGLTQDQGASNRAYGLSLADLQGRSYDAANTQRNLGRADQYNQQGVLGQNANQFQNYQNDARSNDLTNRNEVRGERQYQTNRSDQATQDAITQSNQEEMLRNGVYNRGMGYSTLGYGAQSPVNQYQQAANAAQNGADQTGAGLGNLFQQYFQNQQRRTGAGTGTPVTRYGAPVSGNAPGLGGVA